MPEPTAQSTAAPSGGRGAAPVAHSPVANTARGQVPPAANRGGGNDRRASALADMQKVGSGMKDGTITSTSTPVAPSTTVKPTAPQPQPQKPNAPVNAGPKPNEPNAPAQTPEQKQAAAAHAKRVLDAKRVLSRDGWEPDEINAMDEARLLERADVRRAHHEEVDRRLSAAKPQPRDTNGQFAPKTGEQPKPGEAPAPGQNQPAAGDPSAVAAQNQTPQLPQDLQAIIANAEGTIGKPAAQLLTQITQTIMQQVGTRVQAAEAGYNQHLVNELGSIMERDYPGNAIDQETLNSLFDTACGLLQGGMGRGIPTSQLWSKVLLLHYGPPDSVQNEQRDALARQTAAANGRPDAGTSRAAAANANPPSRKDLLKKAGDLMKNANGRSLEELQRELARQ